MRGVLIFILGSIALASALHTHKAGITSLVSKYIVGYKLFTSKFYKELSKYYPSNLIVCPLSAQYSLAMTLAGAKGPTQSELRFAMNYNLTRRESKKLWIYISKCFKNGTDKYKVSVTNGIFIDNNFEIRESYRGIIENKFRARCETVNFADTQKTTQLINLWVKERTRKIDKFLQPSQLDPTTNILLVNAIFLSAKWATPFKVTNTKPGVFYVSLTKKKMVSYMSSSPKVMYGYDETLGAKFLELPFASGNASLVLVLPDEKDGVTKLEENIEQVLAYKELDEEFVEIKLPKFSFESTLDIKLALANLGAKRVFDVKLADLSCISTKKGLFVNYVVQKAFINVNEAGLEAGAATIALISTKKLPRPGDVTFIADHPFLFYVKVYGDTALFIGRVTSPDEFRVTRPDKGNKTKNKGKAEAVRKIEETSAEENTPEETGESDEEEE